MNNIVQIITKLKNIIHQMYSIRAATPKRPAGKQFHTIFRR